MVMEHITKKSKSERLLHRQDQLGMEQEDLFNKWLPDLLNQRPVQYVLQEAWFGGMPFYVDEQVLIPRPETEELTEWLIQDAKGTDQAVMDIGTGSGCIPALIKRRRPDLHVFALDISQAALEIAKKNCLLLHAAVDFILCDILDKTMWDHLPCIDFIISNPPYIPEKLKPSLDKHVRDFEPPLALFAPDTDPILFYKVIGEMARSKLKTRGAIYLEIHHDHAKEIVDWYQEHRFSISLKKDLSGNNRMIKAVFPGI
jgi:release factor glutamine methyltransferase